MTSNTEICLFCLDENVNVYPTFGDSEVARNTRNVINKYFDVFDPEEINSPESFMCFECWNIIKAFHELYLTVDAIYRKSPTVSGSDTDKDESTRVSPVIEYDTEESQATVIGLEIDILDQSALENATLDVIDAHDNCNDDDEDEEGEMVEVEELEEEVEEGVVSEENTGEEKNTDRKRNKQNPRSDKSEDKVKFERDKNRVVTKIVCYICQKPSKSFDGLRRHLMYHDLESYTFECYLCSNIFPREYLLRHHIRYVYEMRGKYLDRANRRISCPICDKELSHKNLKLHIAAIHKKEKRKKDAEIWKCEECDKKFTSKPLLLQHQRSHDDKELTQVQCDECGKWLKNRYILSMHMKSHDQTDHKCPYCDKIKPNVRALQSHILVAHSKPKHKCSICSTSFTRPKILREHMATYTGKSLYDCSYCKTSFKSNANMYKHMKEYHFEEWNLDRAKKTK